MKKKRSKGIRLKTRCPQPVISNCVFMADFAMTNKL